MRRWGVVVAVVVIAAGVGFAIGTRTQSPDAGARFDGPRLPIGRLVAGPVAGDRAGRG